MVNFISIICFYLLLLILQVIMLVKTIKKYNKKNWLLLLSTVISSIICCGIVGLWLDNLPFHMGWNALGYILFDFIFGVIYVLMLVISIILKVVKNRKNNLPKSEKDVIEKKNIKKSLIINVLIIFIVCLISLSLESIPYIIEYKNDIITDNKANEEIINLLNQRYGNGNFEIVDVVEENICDGCSWLGGGVDGYEFTISTSYLTEDFIISLTKEDFSIYEDNFLDEYYEENLEIKSLEYYLENYLIEKLNETISQKFNIEIDFKYTSVEDYPNKNYGYIPSIEELTEYVELESPKIEIKEDLNTEEELLNYLIEFLKFYINDLDTTNITYLYSNKYFRFKYDYTKLGVNDYTDNYNGYGGYVYKDNNDIIRIYFLNNLVKYNLEDILED